MADTEISTKTDIFGEPQTKGGEPIEEVKEDGEVIAEISTKTDIFGEPQEKGGESIREVTKKD